MAAAAPALPSHEQAPPPTDGSALAAPVGGAERHSPADNDPQKEETQQRRGSGTAVQV